MEQSIEKTILGNLVYNESYTRTVFPFLKPEYFMNISEKTLIIYTSDHGDMLNRLP